MKILKENSAKKVLHIGQDTGGIKTYLGHVFEFSNRLDFEYVVIAPENSTFDNYCKQLSIRYYPVNLLRGGNFFITISSLISIIKVILKEKPDIIHTHSAKGGFLGRLAAMLTGSKNVIYSPHAFSYLSFTGVKRIIFYTLEIIAKRWTTVLLAISYSEAEKSVFEVGYKKNAVRLILNAIPIKYIAPVERDGSLIKINMIGRLTIQKNPMLFLEIAKSIFDKYPNVRFSILGAGIHDELAPELNNYISENALENIVTIKSWVDEASTNQFLKETDIYLMTSIFEGLPYSLLEAMALGKPCVVSNVDGNKDVIRNYENGFSCINKIDFCEKIELLINNRDLRDELGTAGFNYVRFQHNIETNITGLENLYRELCNSPLKINGSNYNNNVIPMRVEGEITNDEL